MTVLGREIARRNSDNGNFVLYVVDALNATYTIQSTKSLFKDAYKRNLYTNGSVEKIEEKNKKVSFKTSEADWLIIHDRNNIYMYISELYCAPIKVRDKKIQEMLDKEFPKMRERINSKRNFAKKMGLISRQKNIPFHIVMAFKGDEKLLDQLVSNVELAIEKQLYANEILMAELISKDFRERARALQYFGIENVPTYQAEKLAEYLSECLKEKKVIRRYE